MFEVSLFMLSVKGKIMVSFYHKDIVWFANLLSCHLATVVVESFEGIAYRTVNMANILQASHLFDTSIFILTKLKGLKV